MDTEGDRNSDCITAGRRDRRSWAFDQLGLAIIVADINGAVTDWNHGAETLFGTGAGEIIGRPLDTVLASTSLAEPRIRIHDALALADRWAGEGSVTRPDGAVRICEFTIAPMENEAGQICGTLLSARDITTRKRTEEALRSVRDFLGEVIDKIGRIVVVVDREGRTVRFNEAAAAATAYDAEDVIGHRLSDLLPPPEEMDFAMHDLRAALRGEPPRQVRRVWQTQDGRRLNLDLTLSALTGKAGTVDYVVYMGHKVADIATREPDESLEVARRFIESRLTRRQREVLGLMSRGLSNRDIASALGLTEATVKLHVRAVLRALEVRNRTQAALMATRAGYAMVS